MPEKTQRQRVLEYLREKGSATKAQLRRALYIENIGNCVDMLRAEKGDGIILTVMEQNVNDKGKHARYFYNGDDKPRGSVR